MLVKWEHLKMPVCCLQVLQAGNQCICSTRLQYCYSKIYCTTVFHSWPLGWTSCWYNFYVTTCCSWLAVRDVHARHAWLPASQVTPPFSDLASCWRAVWHVLASCGKFFSCADSPDSCGHVMSPSNNIQYYIMQQTAQELSRLLYVYRKGL